MGKGLYAVKVETCERIPLNTKPSKLIKKRCCMEECGEKISVALELASISETIFFITNARLIGKRI